MAEIYAWVIVAVAGLAALAGVFLLTRPIEHAFLKTLLRCLAAVWLLLPWQIGVVEGKYAPAFIVAIFEGRHCLRSRWVHWRCWWCCSSQRWSSVRARRRELSLRLADRPDIAMPQRRD